MTDPVIVFTVSPKTAVEHDTYSYLIFMAKQSSDGYLRKTISIDQEHEVYIQQSDIVLSQFVRDKLEERMQS